MDLFPLWLRLSASHLFSDTPVLAGTVAGKQGLSWDPAPKTRKENLELT